MKPIQEIVASLRRFQSALDAGAVARTRDRPLVGVTDREFGAAGWLILDLHFHGDLPAFLRAIASIHSLPSVGGDYLELAISDASHLYTPGEVAEVIEGIEDHKEAALALLDLEP